MLPSIAALPQFPLSRQLTLADKPLVDGLLVTLAPRMSELTFANLYLFRQAHDYRLCRIGGSPVVLGHGYDGTRYALPPLISEGAAAEEQLLAGGMALYLPVGPATARFASDPKVRLNSDRGSFDYLYRRDELATLPGRRFHRKKNRVSYFTSRNPYRVEAYTPAHRDGCLTILAAWQRVRPMPAGSSLALETAACAEALELAVPLGLEGVIVLVEERVVAFALGERLNRETAVCHFEKADPFLDGAGQLVNREFARLLFTDCTYVNREQDLGEPGLRQAKLSYQPVALVEKLLVYPLNQNP